MTSVNYGSVAGNKLSPKVNDAIETKYHHPEQERSLRQKRHESRASEIEAIREKVEGREEEMMKNLLLRPLQIPPPVGSLQSYVVGDVELCLTGSQGLFKYGKGVYDIAKFTEIVQVSNFESRQFRSTVDLNFLIYVRYVHHGKYVYNSLPPNRQDISKPIHALCFILVQ